MFHTSEIHPGNPPRQSKYRITIQQLQQLSPEQIRQLAPRFAAGVFILIGSVILGKDELDNFFNPQQVITSETRPCPSNEKDYIVTKSTTIGSYWDMGATRLPGTDPSIQAGTKVCAEHVAQLTNEESPQLLRLDRFGGDIPAADVVPTGGK